MHVQLKNKCASASSYPSASIYMCPHTHNILALTNHMYTLTLESKWSHSQLHASTYTHTYIHTDHIQTRKPEPYSSGHTHHICTRTLESQWSHTQLHSSAYIHTHTTYIHADHTYTRKPESYSSGHTQHIYARTLESQRSQSSLAFIYIYTHTHTTYIHSIHIYTCGLHAQTWVIHCPVTVLPRSEIQLFIFTLNPHIYMWVACANLSHTLSSHSHPQIWNPIIHLHTQSTYIHEGCVRKSESYILQPQSSPDLKSSYPSSHSIHIYTCGLHQSILMIVSRVDGVACAYSSNSPPHLS